MSSRKTRGSKNSKGGASENVSTANEHEPNASSSQIATMYGDQNSVPLRGYVPPAFFRERAPPIFDESCDSNWMKYADEFRLHLLDQNEKDDIYKSIFSDTRNRQIYALLIKGIGRKSYNKDKKHLNF